MRKECTLSDHILIPHNILLIVLNVPELHSFSNRIISVNKNVSSQREDHNINSKQYIF